jgi:hypothetical protein
MIRWKITTSGGLTKEGKDDGTNNSTLRNWCGLTDWLETVAETIEKVEINIGDEAFTLDKHDAYYLSRSKVKVVGGPEVDTITVGYGNKQSFIIKEYNQKNGQVVKTGEISLDSLSTSIFLVTQPTKRKPKHEAKLDSTASV